MQLTGRAGEPLETLLAREIPVEARRFARAVVRQVAHPLGGVAGTADHERAVARLVRELLWSAERGPEEGADVVFDSPFLSAVFQNLDLLYQDDFPHADGVSLLLMSRAWGHDTDDAGQTGR